MRANSTRSTNGVEKKTAEGFESAPVEQFYSWAFPFSPLSLWDLCLRRFSRQVCSPRGRARNSLSHCPSTGTAGSESCSNTATVVEKKYQTLLQIEGKLRNKRFTSRLEHLHDCWGRSKGQFEGHNNSQRTHQTDRWMCRELHTEQE